jgi:hypothetical protein
VIGAHLEAFLGAAGDEADPPQFVEREFRELLLCGVWRGFGARVRARAPAAVSCVTSKPALAAPARVTESPAPWPGSKWLSRIPR